MNNPIRAVFDCNIFLQALMSPSGPSGRCVAAVFAGQLELYCTSHILDEICETVVEPSIKRKFPHISNAVMAALVQNIERSARFLRHVPETFTYSRDPDDAHYVNVALAAGAKYVVSRDNDLLDLMNPNRPESREFQQRFPHLEIMDPPHLLRLLIPQQQADSP